MSTGPSNPNGERDLYEVLGVERDADAARISKAWRKRTRKAGPGSPEFTRLNDAAETLLNPERRAEYDKTLPAPEPAAAPASPAAPGAPAAPDGSAGADAGSAAPVEAGAAATKRPWALVGLACLTVVTLVAVVLAVVAANQNHRDKETATARTEAVAAARHAMGVVLGYSYKSMKADLQRDLNYLTPSFGKEFTHNFHQLLTASKGKTKSPVQQTKTIVTVAVRGAAIMDASPDKAHVLVFADQTTVHKAGPRKQECPCVLQNRVDVTMVKQDGTWLVDGLRTS